VTDVPAATQPPAGGNDPQSYSPQTACDHPYFPLRLDAKWYFQSDLGDYTWTVTDVTGNLQSAEAIMVVEQDATTLTYHWNCDENGLVSYDFGNIAMQSQASAQYELLEAEGVWLPPAPQVQSGASWRRAYAVAYDFDFGTVSTEATADIIETFSVGALAPVSAPAGEFEALPVEDFGEFSIVVSGSGVTNMEAVVVYYLAHGVGVVRQESRAANIVNTSVLARVEMP
jgi:hypothetical protein